MAHRLEFEKLVSYDVGEPGITFQATLKLKERTLDLQVKVDTGASCCLFERRVGEALGFDIETGMRQLFGTATGTFVGRRSVVSSATLRRVLNRCVCRQVDAYLGATVDW